MGFHCLRIEGKVQEGEQECLYLDYRPQSPRSQRLHHPFSSMNRFPEADPNKCMGDAFERLLMKTSGTVFFYLEVQFV